MNLKTTVLVIGGGPGGATTAALLAREGIPVVLLERARFPRYHIGESLLASCLPVLKLSGAYDAVAAAGFQIKRGGLFHWAGDEWILDWSRLVDEDAWSWQVDRAKYDEILLQNAQRQGANVIEGASVREIQFEGERPVSALWARDDDPETVRTIQFKYVVDASGRRGILAQDHFRMRRQHAIFQNVAMWSYWDNAKLLPKSPEGAINVVSVQDGWWWSIPLSGGRFSVGLVFHKDRFREAKKGFSSLEAYYHDRVHNEPLISSITQGAVCTSQVRAEQDYSYHADRFCGPFYRIVGDAACFLDPLLSTGVHLAQYSALLAAASIASALRKEITEIEATQFYEYVYRRAYTRFLVLVSRLYENYSGKDDYFWSSQKLSHVSIRKVDHAATFTNIITGMTDSTELENSDILGLTEQMLAEAQAEQDRRTPVSTKPTLHDLDMSPSWGPWRQLISADTEAPHLRLTIEPKLGLTFVNQVQNVHA